MLKIYKYAVDVIEGPSVEMPRGAHVLSFQVQHGQPYIWAIVDPDQPMETRVFYLRGTGHELNFTPTEVRFIGTIQLDEGALIFHLFEPV